VVEGDDGRVDIFLKCPWLGEQVGRVGTMRRSTWALIRAAASWFSRNTLLVGAADDQQRGCSHPAESVRGQVGLIAAGDD
jgi:hypothetical protein